MTDAKREIFTRFARLDTWIVGIQYYDGAKEMDSPDVHFDRDADNPFDANAVAVYARSGRQIGHLPRYDAEYFSPLIAQGVIALKGQVGKMERSDRLPLALEVYATSAVSDILVRDTRNDWRAIYHNLFVDLWGRLDEYSSATLDEFRNRFRPLAHEQALHAKTQFLYRMLKAHIADMERREELRMKEQVFASVAAMRFGRLMGWLEMGVIPIDADGVALMAPGGSAVPSAPPVLIETPLLEVFRLLPSRCPYPAGARGAVILVHGEWFSLDWFDAAEYAQIEWYQMILAGVQKAVRENRVTPDADYIARTEEGAKTVILQAMANATCSMAGSEEEGGGTRVGIRAGAFAGNAVYRGGALARLRIQEAQPEIVTEKPMAVGRPKQLEAGH